MPPVEGGAPQTKVFVGRLSSATKSLDLRKLFERFGEVTECDVLGTYGFVHMKSVDQAKTAIQKLNGTELHGSLISVEPSTGQKGRGGGRGGRGGGGPMRGGRGFGGYRGRGSDRFEPYARSYGPPGDSYGGGYNGGGGYGDSYGNNYGNSYGNSYGGGSYGGGAAYGNGYGMDRRPPPVRTAVGGYYDEYERRGDPYARSAAPRPGYDAYERRPPPRDPYAASPYDARGGQAAYERRDDYGEAYGRRSPPRAAGYQAEAAPARAYDGYDRYAAAAPRGASPPRRYAPQHRELTTVPRRY